MEVFVAFTRAVPVSKLGKTLTAWENAGYEPVAIAVPTQKHDLIRQIAAEGLAKEKCYIVADIGSKPPNPMRVGHIHPDAGPGWRLHVKGQDSTLKVEAWTKQESSPSA